MSDRTGRPGFARRCAGWIYRQAVRFFALFGLLSMVYLTCFDYSRITSESMKLFSSPWVFSGKAMF